MANFGGFWEGGLVCGRDSEVSQSYYQCGKTATSLSLGMLIIVVWDDDNRIMYVTVPLMYVIQIIGNHKNAR